ncbi:MAG: DoxX family protein, partial [Microthrixaceae bacterium]|nr:DoxX family protein [Microthrixaceae bacterium]
FVFKDGWEYNFVIGAVAVAVGTLGAGSWSLDDVFGIGADLAGWTGFVIAAGLGLVAGLGTLAIFYKPEATTES